MAHCGLPPWPSAARPGILLRVKLAEAGVSTNIEHEIVEVFELVRGGAPMAVATADAAHRPSCLRGLGVDAGTNCTLTVYVNAALAGRMRADLEVNPRIAITFSRLPDLRSIQLKGVVSAVRPTTPHDHAIQAHYLEALAEQLSLAGLPRSLVRRVVAQPSLAIELEAQELFEQTPGVGAGRVLRATS